MAAASFGRKRAFGGSALWFARTLTLARQKTRKRVPSPTPEISIRGIDGIMNLLRDGRVIRPLVITNFLLLIVLARPFTSTTVYRDLKSMGVAKIIGWLTVSWFGGSTLVVTVVFARSLISHLRRTEADGERSELSELNAVLVVAWWAIVLSILA